VLTSTLVRVRIQGKDIQPSLVKPDAPHHLERAESLVEVFTQAEADGWSRGEIAAACKAVEGDERDHKLVKGLAKVLLDGCDFEIVCPIEPAELRMRAFTESARVGPLARRPNPASRPTAADVLASLDGADPTWLYADLKDAQVLQSRKGPRDAEALLRRYNVALVQAVLIKASDLRIRLESPGPKHVRQLFRYLKFFQLMFRAHTDDGTLVLQLDGPQSLLKSSTRYGIQLAKFLPAILLQPGDWSLESEIRWGKRRLRKALRLDSTLDLRSHYKDTGTWTSRTEQWLLERWEKADTQGWTIGPGALLDLGSQRMLAPDLRLEKDGRVAWLDIVGYWRSGWLKQHLDGTPANVLVAASRRLVGEKKGGVPKRLEGRCIPFAEVIPVADLIAKAEKVAVRE
jgi:uncharacterized protein